MDWKVIMNYIYQLEKEKNGFEKREELGKPYWDDPRWKEVSLLRDKDKNALANALVMKVRESWGL